MSYDFIAIGDMHLRDDQPPSRTDNFWKTQEEKLKLLDEIAEEQYDEKTDHFIAVLQPGDLFHKWNTSHYLVQWCVAHLPVRLYTVPGNHDLPNHNIDLLEKSAFAVLNQTAVISSFPYGKNAGHEFEPDKILYSFPYGKSGFTLDKNEDVYNIALVHTFVYKDKLPFPGCDAPNTKRFLKQFKGFDVIISGDNHQQFEYQTDKQLLINPGCFTRQRYDEKDTAPCAYLVNASERKFEKVPLGAKGNVFQIPFEEDKKRKERINLFVQRLNDQKEVSLSFEDNLKQYIQQNKIPKGIENKIWEVVE